MYAIKQGFVRCHVRARKFERENKARKFELENKAKVKANTTKGLTPVRHHWPPHVKANTTKGLTPVRHHRPPHVKANTTKGLTPVRHHWPPHGGRDGVSKKISVNQHLPSRHLDRITKSKKRQKYRILELERMAVMDLKHKSRVKWMVDGDENSNFFHGFINNTKRRKKIVDLTINGRWSTGVSEIKDEAFKFFNNKFTE
ncbi:hypothetical protein LXL04_028536 [Taraxacum kok-saghyz]